MASQEKIEPRIGLFIWDPVDTLDTFIDVKGISSKLSQMKVVSRCEVIQDPFAETFITSLKKDLQAGNINILLWVGSFLPAHKQKIKSMYAAERFNEYLHEWCDLKEQGVENNQIDREILTRKAGIIIRMSIARARFLKPLEPLNLPATEAVAIIGAGVAGLQAANSYLRLNKKVYLIEKQSGVGGKVAQLNRFFPRMCDPRCGLEIQLQGLRESDQVELEMLSTVKKLEGGPSNFSLLLEKQPRYVNEKKCIACGDCQKVCPVVINNDKTSVNSALTLNHLLNKAIHPATPMSYPPAYVIERQYCPPECNECEKVCPTKAIELDQNPVEKTIKAGAVIVTTGWDMYPLSKVEEFGYGTYENVITSLEMEQLLANPPHNKTFGFIQCVGSRDERHLKYCSSVCCSATLKQVMHLKNQVPNAECYIFYQDIRTPGFDEDLYQKVKLLDNVYFIRGLPSTIKPDGDSGKFKIRAENTLSGEEVIPSVDYVVLAGGMMPSVGTNELAEVLNLPQTDYGFFESHIQCHPEESQRTGIYVGGSCRAPMNVSQSVESSSRAVLWSLPFIEGEFEVKPTFPVLDKTKCDKCKRCVEDCPFSAINFDFDDPEAFPIHDLSSCRQCGICMGTCPKTAISLHHNTIQQAAGPIQVIKAALSKKETPLNKKEDPVILTFLCENDAYPAAIAAAESNLDIPPNVFLRKVSCAGSVNNALIADAISAGVDGVLVLGCYDGECHYVRGNQLARTRVNTDLAEKLESMQIEPERVRFESVGIRESEKYVKILKSYIEELKALGPNPFKI